MLPLDPNQGIGVGRAKPASEVSGSASAAAGARRVPDASQSSRLGRGVGKGKPPQQRVQQHIGSCRCSRAGCGGLCPKPMGARPAACQQRLWRCITEQP